MNQHPEVTGTRRRRSPSEDSELGPHILNDVEVHQNFGKEPQSQESGAGRSGGGDRPRKRPRLDSVNMRSDEPNTHADTNGYTNGTTSPRKAVNGSSNGYSPHAVNGSSPVQSTGTPKKTSPVRSPTYYGHNREEVTRILIQGLIDMGYRGTASFLSQESGYELESPSVSAFRHAIIEGQWTQAEGILLGSHPSDGGGTQDEPPGSGLVLAEGADKQQMLFWIRQQKFLELLDKRDLSSALLVLRQELTPLHQDMHQLHALSSLLMCPREDLQAQARWFGTIDETRRSLLQDLTQCIAPSVMIRDHRLAELLDQVKKNQINECLYHNTSQPPSLYSDHRCERENFPALTQFLLEDHAGEVWHLEFSHDGSKLATASEDKSVIIYKNLDTSFEVLHRLREHEEAVTYLTWSPDDSKIISCSMDRRARVWDVATGTLILRVDHRTPDNSHLTSASWAPDSMTFVTSSFDRATPLCLWSLESGPDAPDHLIHKWNPGLRFQDCAVTPDGRRVVATDSEMSLYVYDLETFQEEYRLPFPCKLTSLTISQDSKNMLVNLVSGEVQLLDVVTGELVRRYEGQKQEKFYIRSTFGGAAENFILSGSEGTKTDLRSNFAF